MIENFQPVPRLVYLSAVVLRLRSATCFAAAPKPRSGCADNAAGVPRKGGWHLALALSGETTPGAYAPGSYLQEKFPNYPATTAVAELGLGLMMGRIPSIRVPTGATFNPNVAALLQQPLTTTVDRQMLMMAPQAVRYLHNVEPVGLAIEGGLKPYEVYSHGHR